VHLLPRRLLLQMLHNYGLKRGMGSWGEARAAAHPLLAHACFCFDRTGHGRMQALLPLLASSPRLLLPPGLLIGVPAATTAAAAGADSNGSAGHSRGSGGDGHLEHAHVAPAAAAAAAVISSELLASGGAASPHKAEQVGV
jgi:hypothetical protein